MKTVSLFFVAFIVFLHSVASANTSNLISQSDLVLSQTYDQTMSNSLAKIIADFRTNVTTSKPRTKPEHTKSFPKFFAESLRQFATEGPQTNIVYQYVKKQNGPLTMRDVAQGAYRPVEKYSAQEVEDGILRNIAAHKAILEHINNHLAEGGEQEQCGFLEFAILTWGKDRNRRLGDRVKLDQLYSFDEIVLGILNDDTLAPSTRIKAALYLREANGMEVLPVLRGIVTNLPPEKPSAELIRSLQRISVFVPETENALNDIETNVSIKTNVVNGPSGNE